MVGSGGAAATGMGNTLERLWQEEEGQDLVEYALVMVLIGLVSIAALNTVASSLMAAFTNAAANMSSTST
jgi:Flp pilus assembly pilin Flp